MRRPHDSQLPLWDAETPSSCAAWMVAVKADVIALVEQGYEVSADDVRRRHGVPPCHPNYLGLVINRLSLDGWIRAAGWTRSVVPTNHGRAIRRWGPGIRLGHGLQPGN